MKAAVLCLLALAPFVAPSGHLDLLHQWATVDYEFPDRASRDRSIRSKEYVPGTAIVPLDVDVWHHGKRNRGKSSAPIWRSLYYSGLAGYQFNIERTFDFGYPEDASVEDEDCDNERTIFMTIPKLQKGVPASLVTVTNKKNGESHLVHPYPDWSWHSQNNCDKMISVFRIQIDQCGRLWAIDSGKEDVFGSPVQRCPPKLLSFHLTNKRTAGKHVFPDNLIKEDSLLTNLAVDVRDAHNECLDTFVYVSDTTEFGLLVFDARRNRSWRVMTNSMYPYPPHGLIQTNSVEFNLMDGIIGLALGPVERGDRKLFFHSFASIRESWVPTSLLRSDRNFSPPQNSVFREFRTSEEARSSQTIAEAFDRNGILYFVTVGDNALRCWNSRTPFTQGNIHEMTRDNVNLQLDTSLKIILNEDDEEEIWLLTNRLHLVISGQLRESEVNFRVIRGKVEEIIRDSKCVLNSHISFPNRTKTNTNKPYLRPASSNYGRFAVV